MNSQEKTSKAEQELYYAMTDPHADWFTAQLIRLFLKADPTNYMKLRSAYPDIADVVYRYSNEPNYWDNLKKRIHPKKTKI